LAEVVVTAQRRSERLQDVPISVSVFNQATMDAQGIRDIDDLARLTPGLNFTRGAVNNNSDSSGHCHSWHRFHGRCRDHGNLHRRHAVGTGTQRLAQRP
jgi:hypothetical protein